MLNAHEIDELRRLAAEALTDTAACYAPLRVERDGGSHEDTWAEPAAHICSLVGGTLAAHAGDRRVDMGDRLVLAVLHNVDLPTGTRCRLTLAGGAQRWVEVVGSDGPGTNKVLRRYAVQPCEPV